MDKIWIPLVILVLVLGWAFSSLDEPLDYYEYPAASETECLPGELFDAEYGVCYFDYLCTTDEECDTVSQGYQSIIGTLVDTYRPNEITRANDVLDGDLSDEERMKIIISLLLPENYHENISEIIEDGDGPDGTLAYVEVDSDDGSEWKLAYDKADSFTSQGYLQFPEELLATLVHEYAHVLSLENTQVRHIGVEVEEIVCNEDEIIIDEGCLLEDSYLGDFIDLYWPLELREAAQEAYINLEEEFAASLYEESPDLFVTEYAATNAAEDFAESFTEFVMDRIEDSATVADEKAAFFNQYSELVELREYMREGIYLVLESELR